MDIILLERVENLGKIGDVVTVKDGYARNYLLPRKKALRATEANKKYFETQKKQIEAHNKQLMEEAAKLSKKVEAAKVVVLRQAGDTGQLYGSVTSRDISHELKEQGFEVESGKIILDKPIKEVGVYDVSVHLHPEVSVKLKVNVARSSEEAQSQEELHEKAREVFESEELAKEAEERLAGKEPAAKEAEEGEEAEAAEAAGKEKAEKKEKTAKGEVKTEKKAAKEEKKAEKKAAPAKDKGGKAEAKAEKKQEAKKGK